MSGEACACLRVKYSPVDHGGGSFSERWACADCLREFVPRSRLVVDLLDCGHPLANQNRSVETGVTFCDFCRGLEMLRDALASEASLRAQVKELQRVVGDQVAEMQAAWSALRACDFHLDEWASGACRVPPTAGPLAVSEAVRQCVDALHLRLAEARAQVAALTTKTYCAYCGEATALDDEAATKVGEHIRRCPKHPIAEYRHRCDELEAQVAALTARTETLRDISNMFSGAVEHVARHLGFEGQAVLEDPSLALTAIAKAVAAEREACAQAVEDYPESDHLRMELVIAIRARGGQ